VTGVPDARPSPAGSPPPPQRVRFLPGPFAGWALAGVLWGLCLASILTIGVFLMPVALIVTVVMCMGYTRPDGWPGLLCGLGLIGIYLGLASGGGTPFLVGGIVLVVVCAPVSWRWYTRPVTPRHWRSRA
jgi:hypothetical protein